MRCITTILKCNFNSNFIGSISNLTGYISSTSKMYTSHLSFMTRSQLAEEHLKCWICKSRRVRLYSVMHGFLISVKFIFNLLTPTTWKPPINLALPLVCWCKARSLHANEHHMHQTGFDWQKTSRDRVPSKFRQLICFWIIKMYPDI